MRIALPQRAERSFLAPEVIQTSAMDCGPAALKCLLEGYRKNASYGRLREACQTGIDGTSIDVIETVANQLGLDATQEMIPSDHFLCDPDTHLPAMIVLRRPDGTPHFAIAWRRFGHLLQLMDPATGRRWSNIADVMTEAWQHQMPVAAQDWRHWAGSDDCLAPLRTRLAALCSEKSAVENAIARALADPEWFALGALDACTRFVQSMVAAGGTAKGAEAQRLLLTLFEQTITNGHDIFSRVPEHYWSVSPDRNATDPTRQRLVMRGIVLLRVNGARAGSIDEHASSLELKAAMSEKPVSAPAYLWDTLKADGLLAPLVLISALGVSALATVIEALLARGLFDISNYLNVGSQRLAGAIAILVFVILTLLLRIPINTEAMRIGRAFDARLRMALLTKIPNLSDRYFQSRPISDMADRGHMLHMLRLVPGKGVHFVQLAFELLLTLVGLLLIDAQSGLIAIGVAAIAIAVPFATQSLVSERDLRVRTQSAALSGFYLDALLGIAPIKAHRAQRAIEHRHEALLSEWTDSNRAMIRTMLTTAGFQSFFCFGLTGLLLVEHFVRLRGVTGADLLLVFWAMKLPSIGGTIASLAHQYPSTRNILLRLLEPLNAPELEAPQVRAAPNNKAGMSALIDNVTVVQSGHTILRDVSLSIRAGEHVALIGPSGAGKSTLLGLLLGWNRPASGAFFIDGVPSDEQDMTALRQQVAWIDPAVQLWNTSLMENLTFASCEPEQANVAEAIGTAQLRSVLENLPGGFQGSLGEGGSLLSGGEGQRVRFARALLQPQTRLAILDEPFRGLDRARRTELLQRVRRHWENVTLLCATHDIAETQAFDRVVIIENGRIVENDLPSRLAARPSRYRALLDAERMMQEQLGQFGQLGMANASGSEKHWRRLIVDHANVQEAPSGRDTDAAIMRLVRKAP